jgi:hypothetical protein
MFSAWLARGQAHESPSLTRRTRHRPQVNPPAGLGFVGRLQRDLREWLNTGWNNAEDGDRLRIWPRKAAAPLEEARRDFSGVLCDVTSAQADELLRRIRIAMSLRELWHLRAEAFELVSRQHSQADADERLALLNRHFPTRSPRSGFAPFDSSARGGR